MKTYRMLIEYWVTDADKFHQRMMDVLYPDVPDVEVAQ